MQLINEANSKLHIDLTKGIKVINSELEELTLILFLNLSYIGVIGR